MTGKIKILFDFDGTLCKIETIPYIAKTLKLKDFGKIESMTMSSGDSFAEYESNLRKRISMMREVEVENFIDNIPLSFLRKGLADFIMCHNDVCEIVSCNLDCWCRPLVESLEVPCRFSKANVFSNHVVDVEYIVNKEEIVRNYKDSGAFVVFVGDSANDLSAMQIADVAFLIDNGNIDLNNISKQILVFTSEVEIIDHLESILKDYDYISDRRTTLREK